MRGLIALLCVTALLLMHTPVAVAVTSTTTIDLATDSRDVLATTGTWDTATERWSLTNRYPELPTFTASVPTFHPAAAVSDKCGEFDVEIGDVDGNGRGDLVFSCYLDDVGAMADAGSVVVATRNAANTGFNPGIVLTHPSPAASDGCGIGVAMGDLNADGRDDVVLACWSDDVGAVTDAGSAVVFTRNVANTGFDPAVVLTHPAPSTSDRCGDNGTLAVGDVNGDARDDVVLGCPYDDVSGVTDAGSAVVFARRADNTGFDAGVPASRSPLVASDYCGTGLAVGDADADGRGDILLGCFGLEIGAANDAGGGVVLLRDATNTGFTVSGVLSPGSPAASENCGVDGAFGDVNGDGRDDAVLGCWRDDVGATDSGSLTVLARNAGNTGFDAPVELRHPILAASDVCAAGIATGDLDGNGRDELIAGCKGRDNLGASSGSVLVWRRNDTNTGFRDAWERDATSGVADDECGASVATGDVDGDGLADLAFGCAVADAGATVDAGSIHVMRSTSGLLWTGVEAIGSGSVHRAAGVAAGDECGVTVRLADVNYDGRDDMLQGCWLDDGTFVDEGSLALSTRNAANSGFDAPVRLPSPVPGANSECGNLAAGDFNGDTKADVIMGCQKDDTDAFDAGSLVVMRRNPQNTGFVQARLTHPALAASDLCGARTALGDVNGDGYLDALMGCPLDDGAASNVGSVVLFMRNASGFGAGTLLTHASPVANDECGYGAAMGDVNGDGRADIVIGCAQDDVTVAGQGSALVFTRNAANSGFDAPVVLAHPTPVAGDTCGFDTAVGDLNDDGRADVVLGCQNDDVGAATGAGSAVLFLRRNDNAGFAAGVVLSPPTPVSTDMCGDSMAIGDLTGDGRTDIAVGCRYLDTASSNGGGAYVYARNASNTGFDPAVAVASTTTSADAGCGISLAIGDVNGDGRDELAIGCYLADSVAPDAGELLLRETKRALVQTTTVASTTRPITSATLSASLVANSGVLPALEASANGGSNWETVSPGVAHTFAFPGTDLRIRARITDTRAVGYASSPWVSGDIGVSYSFHEPRVTGASPSVPQGRRGIVVSIAGTEFDNGAIVGISGTGITITNTARVSASRIDVTLDVAGDATAGSRDVTVTNPDTGTHTGTGVLSVTSSSISIAVSSLGFADASRDVGGLSWGLISHGTLKQIGPTGSGQTLAGPALRVAVTSDTTWQLRVEGTALTDGARTIPASALAWKRHGITETWTAYSSTPQTILNLQAPGSSTREYDAQLSVPIDQTAGTYAGSLTYTVTPQP